MILTGTEGPFVSQVRALLMPQPLRELRVKNAYVNHKAIIASQGVKICGKDLEKALAGTPVFVARKQDEVEVFKVGGVWMGGWVWTGGWVWMGGGVWRGVAVWMGVAVCGGYMQVCMCKCVWCGRGWYMEYQHLHLSSSHRCCRCFTTKHVHTHAYNYTLIQDEAAAAMKSTLSTIQLQERGVFVQASTLGSLEALLAFLKNSKIPVCCTHVHSSHSEE